MWCQNVGGINIRRKIKFNDKQYNIGVYKYYDGKIKLKYENKTESHDITLNLNDVFLEKGKILIDPFLEKNGLLSVLLKDRIIKDIIYITYNYMDIPVAKLNMGVLKQYDKYGVLKYLEDREESI